MSRSYLLKQPTAKKTPQSKPIPGRERDMTRNNAGAFAFKADSWMRMERFLILGSAGGSFYVGESDLTSQNVDVVRACIAQDGKRAVHLIRDISVAGRAPKNDPAIYALALAASCDNPRTRDLALAELPSVCRIGTHLFTFAAFIDSMRGWGSALRKAVAEWYLSKPVERLAYQILKYQQREGWSHRDLLRLSHPNPGASVHAPLLSWVVKGETKEELPLPQLVHSFEIAKSGDEKTVIKMIGAGLTREMIPTQCQKSPAVWEALLENMPMTAMIRTLGRMGSVGLLAPLSSASRTVCERLGDRQRLRQARVHPIQLLSALLTYKQGRGQRGSLTWQAVPQVVDALDAAFYMAFDHVEPTNKNFYLGIDVSGSMTMGEVAGIVGLTPNMGAAAMAMLVARTEPNYFIGGFSTQFIDLGVTARDTLADAMRKCQRNYGGTDCAIAIKHALANKYPVDAFVVVTDGETWAGTAHSSQAIQQYRQRMGRDSKLIVINMVANHTRITDPTDVGSLDICGFDASVPTLIAEFIGARGTAKATVSDEAEG